MHAAQSSGNGANEMLADHLKTQQHNFASKMYEEAMSGHHVGHHAASVVMSSPSPMSVASARSMAALGMTAATGAPFKTEAAAAAAAAAAVLTHLPPAAFAYHHHHPTHHHHHYDASSLATLHGYHGSRDQTAFSHA